MNAFRYPIAVATVLLLCQPVLRAQTYEVPPAPIRELAEAAPVPVVNVNPPGTWMLLLQQPGFPSIAELAEPELRIGGLRINPALNGPSRTTGFVSLQVKPLDASAPRPVTGLPDGARFSSVTWSPDGTRFALIVKTAAGLQLWLGDPVSASVKPLSPADINAAFPGTPYEWMPDSRALFYRAVPAGRGPAPALSQVPDGPSIQETAGKTGTIRTYQDLLKNRSDETLFAYYLQAEPVLIGVDGQRRTVGGTALYTDISSSPDGRYYVATFLKPPFSYLVPASLFPQVTEVRAMDGSSTVVVADRPLADNLPKGADAARPGPRTVGWRADAPATLFWAEALDGGDPAREMASHDRIMLWEAPFSAPARPLMDLTYRFSRIQWGRNDLAVVTERWIKSRQEQTWRIDPSKPGTATKLGSRDYQDRYADPGSFMTAPNAAGWPVLLLADKGKTLFLAGAGASPEGDRPFVDAYDLATGKKTRLFQSRAPFFEQPVQFVNVDQRRLLIRRESIDLPGNFQLEDLKTKKAPLALTTFGNPYAALQGVKKQVVQYRRADGLDLKGDLYLPAGYDAARDGRLPVFMWAYPGEYKTAAAAAQVTGSPYQFTYLNWGSPVYWVSRGYAVFNNIAMPVIGEGNAEPNDTFREQIVANAKAAIDILDQMGIADRRRIAVGGHSYGAFMTANLLAHSDLFAAGIARSGAYNRTLTPFGFQAEERTFWDAEDTYHAMSPFTYANRINEPLLLIHGEADNNSGTFPIQSERLYAAIKGLGGTARLVMLPHESHGYAARESVLHMLWEMDRWLETRVKNRP